MSDIQKHNQGLIQPEDTLLVKVPYVIYNSWWQTAADYLSHGVPQEEREKKIFSLLTKWVEKTYPGYGIAAFEDYSEVEAKAVSLKLGKTIDWGMYVLLQIGASTQQVSITDKLLEL